MEVGTETLPLTPSVDLLVVELRVGVLVWGRMLGFHFGLTVLVVESEWDPDLALLESLADFGLTQ